MRHRPRWKDQPVPHRRWQRRRSGPAHRRAPCRGSGPTVAESGFEGYEAITWNGLIGPVGLPTQIVRQIEGALTKHMADPVIAQRLTELGVNADTGSSIDFAERIKRELPIWAVVVKAAGVQQ
jgi:tripartite-type tricarboxylate transporter receptor subunit TctC